MYKIRALFNIPEYCRIESDEKMVELCIHDQIFYLSGYKSDTAISGNNILVIDCGEYQYQDKGVAEDDLVLLNQALMLTALDLRIGISYDDHCMVDFFNNPIKEFFNKKFSQFNIYAKCDFGLSCYEKDAEFYDINLDYKEKCSVAELKEAFTKYYGRLRIQDEKIMSALLLANAVMFQASFTARILLCMIVIEMLAEDEKRCDEEIELIDRMIELIKGSSLDSQKKQPLLSCVHDLKKKSISKRCQNLIEKHLDLAKRNIFRKLYQMRSEYVHAGVQFKDAYSDATDAFSLVRDLLFEIIRKSQA